MNEDLNDKVRTEEEQDHEEEDVDLTMDGPGFHLERKISESQTADVMRTIADSEADGNPLSTVDPETNGHSEGGFELTDDVLNTLSKRQNGLIHLLLEDADEDDGGWVTSSEIVSGMEEVRPIGSGMKESRPIGQPGNIGGIRGGMTQKYGEDNDIIEKGQKGDETAYRLNPEYREEFKEHFEGTHQLVE